MPNLPEDRIAQLLHPYLTPTAEILPRLSAYLDLLLKWNARTNLTAIREPELIVQRHFGESLFTAQHLHQPANLLDVGSGAGFPGIPIALMRPEIQVTLAESQNKKATFLREVVRTVNLINVEIWPARAEALPETRSFHTVTLRAVDNMDAAMAAAAPRAIHEILVLAGDLTAPTGFEIAESMPTPNSISTRLIRIVRTSH
jgi:16S rRNA (guanine527-N7)-methyltransferase